MYSTQKEFPYSKEGWRKLVNVILEFFFFTFARLDLTLYYGIKGMFSFQVSFDS